MYVCICKGITDQQIRDTVCDGACSLKEVSRQLGVGTCCGKCSQCARSVIEETLDQASQTARLAHTGT